MNTYSAKLVEIIDGDTLLLYIDLGFYVYTMAAVRLTGIDLDTDPTSVKREEQAVKWMEKFFENVDDLALETHKDEEGTLTADIIVNGVTVNQEMERRGLSRGAVRFLGPVH